MAQFSSLTDLLRSARTQKVKPTLPSGRNWRASADYDALPKEEQCPARIADLAEMLTAMGEKIPAEDEMLEEEEAIRDHYISFYLSQQSMKKAKVQLLAMGIPAEAVTDDNLSCETVNIEEAYRSFQSCQSCQKSGKEAASCTAYQCRLDANGRLVFGVAFCQRSKQAKAEMAQMKKAKEELANLRISPRFANRRFSNFRVNTMNKACYDTVRQWVVDYPHADGTGIFLYGMTGNGKTHLAVSALQELYETRRVPGRFVTMMSFLSGLRSHFDDPQGYANYMKQYEEAALLVLDDFDKFDLRPNGVISPWSQGVIYELVNYRYENNLPIIFTSNQTVPQLRLQIGNALASRIAGMSIMISDRGEDLRMQKAASRRNRYA